MNISSSLDCGAGAVLEDTRSSVAMLVEGCFCDEAKTVAVTHSRRGV